MDQGGWTESVSVGSPTDSNRRKKHGIDLYFGKGEDSVRNM